jgi:eukaryotic-like serine/threonine-protein kinase
MSQDSENWSLLQTLFHLAEETPAEDRARVLAEHCTDESIVRRALEIFRGYAALEDTAPVSAAPVSPGRIGSYTLLRLLGSGGIGTVYLAERMVGGSPQRSALKMLAPHAAGASFIERFHREQHILGSLDHANITRLIDAGLTDAGQPYLVMEYVDGEHLDAYCDNRKLGIVERLQLFLHVCDAVAYAHRSLVVHLDLKPSNILVSQDGVVKLLDFGTSKLIQTDSLFTTTVMATPAYASPEQLRNEPVTTACDIYSLGAVLFELLSGRRPYAHVSVAAMIEQAMKEQEPEKLAVAVSGDAALQRGVATDKLRQTLHGDLETIAEKCLRPRPMDRYVSVDALMQDVERYLAGRPVLARPQTTFYRLGKFARRNRSAITISAVALMILVGSLTYAFWRQQQALREGQRAVRMQTFMYRLFKLANSNYTGKPAATVPEFLELGARMLPDYVKNPADLREAELSMAESMYENGEMDSARKVFAQTIVSAKAAGDVGAEAEAEAFSGNIAYQQGPVPLGEQLTAHALELSRKAGVAPAVRVWSAIYYAWNRENLGDHSDENLRLLQFAAKESLDYHLPPHQTAEALDNLGGGLDLHGREDEAEAAYTQALQIYEQDPASLCDQSEVYGDLAYIKDKRNEIPASLQLYQRAYAGYKACAGSESRGTLIEQDYLAGALIKLGRAAEAIPIIEASLPAWRKVAGSSPDVVVPFYFLTQAYFATGRYSEAEKAAKTLVELQEGKVVSTDRRLGVAHLFWARALVAQHRDEEAIPHAEIADRLPDGPNTKQLKSEAHQLLLDIRSRHHEQ